MKLVVVYDDGKLTHGYRLRAVYLALNVVLDGTGKRGCAWVFIAESSVLLVVMLAVCKVLW